MLLSTIIPWLKETINKKIKPAMLLIWSLLMVAAANGSNTPIDGNYKECSPNESLCEYWFTVTKTITMVYQGSFVYAYKSKLYKVGEFPNNYTTEVPIDEVLAVDGVSRAVLVVNGTIPGPPIIVYENQNVKIHVTNALLSDSLSMHWHGIHQMGSPFMDGTAFITQCPILAEQTFTYQFQVGNAGTHWYHSHSGTQRMDGIFGAFIVKERPVPSDTITQPVDMIMTVGDWEHKSADDLFVSSQLVITGDPWRSGLIEGKGRYIDESTGKRSNGPVTWYKVMTGQKYRFRVINFGALYSVRVSVDNHNIAVIATDGYDVKAMTAESFVISPGERYDFLVTADQAIGNYWIRADYVSTFEREITPDGKRYVEAVLHYEGASTEDEPQTGRDACTNTNKCKVLNCPFYTYPDAPYVDCVLVTELEGVDGSPTPEYDQESQEHFLNFHLPGPPMTLNPGAVNGHQFKFPRVSSLTQTDEIDDVSCTKANCGDDKVCTCNHEVELPYNKIIQFVFINMGKTGTGHPIHMHGHSFYVLKMEYISDQELSQPGFAAAIHKDVNCSTPKRFCNNAQWKNQTWENGNVPGLKMTNAIRKDTLYIPSGAYAVVRIRSNNPGKWFVHCHMLTHALQGMAVVLSEGMGNLPEIPKDFPICASFNGNAHIVGTAGRLDSSNNTYQILAYVFIAICTLQFITFLIYIGKGKASSDKKQLFAYVQNDTHM